MGNAPSTDLPRTESHGRTVEVMETDEKSQGFNELATTNPKPKDDGSSNLNPLHGASLFVCVILHFCFYTHLSVLVVKKPNRFNQKMLN